MEFTHIAEILAQIIVDELHVPDSAKAIAPAHLGGVAGACPSAPINATVNLVVLITMYNLRRRQIY